MSFFIHTIFILGTSCSFAGFYVNKHNSFKLFDRVRIPFDRNVNRVTRKALKYLCILQLANLTIILLTELIQLQVS